MARFIARTVAAVAAFAFIISPSIASAQSRPLAEAFVAQMADVEISPDGRYISMLQPLDNRHVLAIYPVGGGQPATISAGQRLPGENLEIVGHFWAGPEHVVMWVQWSGERNWYGRRYQVRETRLLSVSPDGRDVQVLFERDQDILRASAGQGTVISDLPDDPDHILVAKGSAGSAVWTLDAHRVDLNTGRSVIVASGGPDTAEFFTDARGNIVGRVDYSDGEYTILRREGGSLSWREIHSYEWFGEGEGQRQFTPLIALDNGRTLYVRSNHEGRIGIYSMDLENGGGLQRVFLHDQVDAGTFYYDEDEDRPIRVSYTVDLTAYHFFDAEEERLYNSYSRALPGAVEFQASETDDGNMRVIGTLGPGDPPVYYLMDLAAGSINEIGQMYPELNPDNMPSVQAISYPARDGTMIPAYLALPPGVDASDGPLPFVLYPHGGPIARDTQSFDPVREFISSRGYAVLAPNFRGSDGYGVEWEAAGYEQWGGLMQTDLIDGVNYLIDQGIADPDRMCFVGWSYSAYAALYAATDTPDMFNCYVGINGVYDLPALQGDLRSLGADWALDWWGATMGSDATALAAVSPARRADRITRPVLIIASEEDRTAPPQESRRMIAAMQAAGVPYESHFFRYGDHSMSYEESWIGNLELVESFLARHIDR